MLARRTTTELKLTKGLAGGGSDPAVEVAAFVVFCLTHTPNEHKLATIINRTSLKYFNMFF